MNQISLFETENSNNSTQPLAARMRPRSLDEFVGQKHLVGEGKVLRNLIERDSVSSMIFWGPPGVGKTTLAQIIAASTDAQFINFSAVTSGIKDIKTVMQQADKMTAVGTSTVSPTVFAACMAITEMVTAAPAMLMVAPRGIDTE